MSCKCYWSHFDCGEHSVATKVTEDTVVYARTSIAFGKSKTLSRYFSTSSEMILRSALWTNFPHLKIIVSITSAHLIVRWSLRSCQQIESWNDDRCSHTAERSGESWQMTSDRVHRYFRLWVAERPSGETTWDVSTIPVELRDYQDHIHFDRIDKGHLFARFGRWRCICSDVVKFRIRIDNQLIKTLFLRCLHFSLSRSCRRCRCHCAFDAFRPNRKACAWIDRKMDIDSGQRISTCPSLPLPIWWENWHTQLLHETINV